MDCHKLLAILLFALLGAKTVQAQDARFSQFFTSGSYSNPALTGADGTMRMSLHYRHQWSSLEIEFLTGNFMIEGYLPTLKSGFGLRILNDWASGAAYQAVGIGGLYAYQLSLGKDHFLRTGAELALESRNLDYFRFNFGDQFNEEGRQNLFTQERFLSNPLRFFNLSYGLFWQYRRFWVSASARNLTRPRQAISQTSVDPYRLPIFYSWGTGGQFYLSRRSEDWQLLPSFHWAKRGWQTLYQTGLQVRYSAWSGGMALLLDSPGKSKSQSSSKWMALTGFQHGPWRFSYSFELNLSRQSLDLGNVHEFSLIFYPFSSKLNSHNKSPVKTPPFPSY